MIGPAVRRLLVGGYTDEPSDGVGPRGLVTILHDLYSGSLSQSGPALELPSPSYLLRHPGAPLVYAVSETEPGAVSAIEIGSRLQVMSTLAIPGRLPCHLCLSPDLGHLLVANYGSGDVVALRLGDDGVPQEVTGVFSSYGQGPHPRQEGPHAHHIQQGPDGTYWMVDLGADVVRRLYVGPDGKLLEGEPVVALPAGTGPRQIRVSADGRTAYVLGELSEELITLALRPGQSAVMVNRRPGWLTEPPVQNLPAHLLVAGRRLYVSHRGLNRITVFSLDNELPIPLMEIETGAWPRHFALAGGWLYIADQLDDQVTARALTAAGDSFGTSVHTTVRRPTCVLPL
jgi:6-phosphogluconolactonase (cycloisomerase 2 family)